METIGFGFLIGIGIILAVLVFCLVIVLFVLLGMFFGYLSEKNRKRADWEQYPE